MHTPKPWHRHWRSDVANIILDEKEEKTIAVVEALEDKEEEAANVALIISAPNLLERLDNLLSRVETMAEALRRQGLGIIVNDWLDDGILDDARAAIAEAKGEIHA